MNTARRTSAPHAVVAVLAVALAGVGCGRSDPPPAAPAAASSGPSLGTAPSHPDNPAASDRPGQVAEGAVEAGQASGGGTGAPPQPTGGDGSAGAPASAPPSASGAPR